MKLVFKNIVKFKCLSQCLKIYEVSVIHISNLNVIHIIMIKKMKSVFKNISKMKSVFKNISNLHTLS
jgi:hypothetical protein